MKSACRIATVAAGMSLVTAPAMTAPAFAAPHHWAETATPVEHLVVIFQENVDHYFGTYPFAAKTDGSTFNPADGTPSVNGLGALLTNNPNAGNPANGVNAINPFRLSHSQATTCDQNHDYGPEQTAFDFGLMDAFPVTVGVGSCGGFDYGKGKGLVMGYYDGNTTTALWNYAQHFAMSDNSFGTTFGPSSPGALNLASGQTGGVIATGNGNPVVPGAVPDDEVTGTTVTGDPQPYGDACSTRDQARLGGTNIGDLLNAKGVSWGFFQGGFDLTKTNPNGTTGCHRSHPASGNVGTKVDYIPHHEPFQYYLSTANLAHTRPTVPPSQYGTSADTVTNHQYDSDNFFAALSAGNMPAVTFLKAPGWQDGHAGYIGSAARAGIHREYDQYDNDLEVLEEHCDRDRVRRFGRLVRPSDGPNHYSSATDQDTLTAAGKCGKGTPLNGIQGRCGYGPRLPPIVVSPFAKENFVDHSTTDQSSILRFIEDNWGTGQIGGGSFDELAGQITNMLDFSNKGFGSRKVLLDPGSGN